MSDLNKTLRHSFRDPEYADLYSESFLDMFLATQIKVLREQRGLSQSELGTLIGTTQGGVSRIEDANYSGWSVKTLKKIARALRVRLRISMEEFGTLPDQVVGMNKASLMRAAHENDAVLFPEKLSVESKVRDISEGRLEGKQIYAAVDDDRSQQLGSGGELPTQYAVNTDNRFGAMYG